MSQTIPSPTMTPPTLPPFSEHLIPHGAGSLFVRDFPGSSPAFICLHGFPDNGHIFDYLATSLASSGRRVVTLDFLGFGSSDKPRGEQHYSFAQQVGDVEAVVTTLGLDKVVLVGHDAGGPAAVNYALRHPGHTAGVVLMNAFYAPVAGLRLPEFIELFATPTLRALHLQFLKQPQQFGWLLNFQREQMQAVLDEGQKERYESFLGPLIDGNFRQQPSALGAFVAMTADTRAELARNEARLVELRTLDVSFSFIWGKEDPYLHVSTAEWLSKQVRKGSLHKLDAGHWPQIDEAERVAEILIAEHPVAEAI